MIGQAQTPPLILCIHVRLPGPQTLSGTSLGLALIGIKQRLATVQSKRTATVIPTGDGCIGRKADVPIGLMAASKSSSLPMTVKCGGLILPSKRKRNRSLEEEDMAHANETLGKFTDRRDLVTSIVARSFTVREQQNGPG